MNVSVRDVAQHAGVSVGTVSNVLNHPGKVSTSTVRKVRAAIEALGFIRNDAARQLRAGVSRTIGLVVLDVRNPFFSDLAKGAEEVANEHEMSILLADSNEDPAREAHFVGLFEEQRVAGLLISPVSTDLSSIRGARERGTALVLVDSKASDDALCSVSVDDVYGGQLAVTHLIGEGRRRILFVGGPIELEQVSNRLLGAQIAAGEIDGVNIEIKETKSMTVLEGRLIGEQLLTQSPSNLPDAVFAANDLLALGIMQALVSSRTLQIPEDIAIVGYDDIPYASTAVIPLSSVRQPASEIGAKAVEMLLRESGEPSQDFERQVVFQPHLVVRDSSQKQVRFS